MRSRIAFRWLTAAGIELRTQETALVIDPYLTRVPWWRMLGRPRPNYGLIAEKVPRCDYVLVTHAHIDHVLDVPEVVSRTGAIAFGSPNVVRILKASGIPTEQVHEVREGDTLTLGPFRVTVLPAKHTQILGRDILPGDVPEDLDVRQQPLRGLQYRMDADFSFSITVDGLRVVVWSGPSPSRLAEGGDSDTAALRADVLFVNALAPEIPALIRDMTARLIIPIHWDNFFRPLSKPLRPMLQSTGRVLLPFRRFDPTRFVEKVATLAPAAQVLVPEPFWFYNLHDVV